MKSTKIDNQQILVKPQYLLKKTYKILMFFFVYKDKKLRHVNILNRVLKVKENPVDTMSKHRLLWKLSPRPA